MKACERGGVIEQGEDLPRIGNHVLNHRKYALRKRDAAGVTSIYTSMWMNHSSETKASTDPQKR